MLAMDLTGPVIITFWAGSLALVTVSAAVALRNIGRRLNRVMACEAHANWTLNTIKEAIYRATPDGEIIAANQALIDLMGEANEADTIAALNKPGLNWHVDPEIHKKFRSLLFADERIEDFISQVFKTRSGEPIWVTENAWIVRDAQSSEITHIEGTVRDISASKMREETEALLSNLAEHVPGGLFQCTRDPDGNWALTYANRTLKRISGFPTDCQIDLALFNKQIHPDDWPNYRDGLEASIRVGAKWECEFRLRRPEGNYIWVSVSGTPQEQADGSMICHGFLEEIEERKRIERQMHALAFIDPVTRLANRAAMLQRLEELRMPRGDKKTFRALAFLDLDNFKHLNDTYGHDLGDDLLRRVGRVLREVAGPNAMVARFGGDEFVVLFEKLGQREEEARLKLQEYCKHIMGNLRKPDEIKGVYCRITGSMGVTLFSSKASRSSDELLKHADLAMYRAKRSGRDACAFFEESDHNAMVASFVLQRDLPQAIEHDQFELEYQPQVNAQGHIVACEALIRWNHPTQGRIMPDAFIPLAEENGHINLVNRWVMAQAVETLQIWDDSPRLSALQIAVNLNAEQLLDRDFTDAIAEELERSHIPLSRMVIEVTEHGIAREIGRVVERMEAMRDRGFSFSLDDFGTGYSSLSHLKLLPVDELKIDGAFITALGDEDASDSLVRAILGISKALGIRTVAEHVAEQRQLERLQDLGCDLFQGYLFARSMPRRDFETFVEANRSPQNSAQPQVKQKKSAGL